MISKDNSNRVLFEQAEFEPRRRSVRVFLLLAAVFMMVGGGVDLMVYPFLAESFFVYRLIAAVILLVGWLVLGQVKSPWLLRLLSHVLVLVPVLGIELMMFDARDPASSYYGGVNVVLVGVALFLRWRVIDSVVNSVICVLSFIGVMSMIGLTYRGGLIPSYFVLVTGVIAVLATYFYKGSRFREFCLLQEIQETNQQLRATDETKARFFANISHELRTPLTLILGPLENLRVHKKYRKDTLVIEHLDMIEDNAMRLLRLINDILDLVKLDSDESPPRPELIDVEEFVVGISNNMKPVAALKKINFVGECEVSEQKMVWLDRDRLDKIVLNLTVNAVKFTPPGGFIKLSAETKGGRLTLKVQDTGEGMDEKVLGNVFVRFWQADMSAKRKHRGAGIGLALVKSLTESMGGEIQVESKLNQGTLFTVALPAPEPDEKARLETQTQAHDVFERFNEQAQLRGVVRSGASVLDKDGSVKGGKEGVVPAVEPRKRILVAEDEDAMRAFIARQLEDYEVIEAKNGREAWELARHEQPDLMILDYMMPELDGIELTSKCRGELVTARIPIILVTAQAGEAARLRALDSGVNDFLTKPFSSVELLARARNLLSNSEFETQLAENNVYLEAAYQQLKDQEAILVQTEKLSSLGRMSAGIVHEINNPLNYTQTALYALKSFERELPEEEREDYLEVLADAREGVSRVVGIVQGLRSFTRGDAVVMSEVRLADVVEHARKLCSQSIQDVDFRSDVDEALVIEGNEIQLCQLFVNLFQNAARAISVRGDVSEEPSIQVKADVEGDQGIVMRVRDNGCGIKQEDVERIFDPFFTKNDVGEGMGLGLSISYRILEQHSARIEVQSEWGEFTEFTIYFSGGMNNV